MWIIAKYNKNSKNFFINEFSKKIKNTKFYYPNMVYRNKGKFIAKNILENYIFCFNTLFKDEKNIDQIRYIKGLDQVLEGYKNSQLQILNFINLCKKNENEDGSIGQNFFDQFEYSKVKFLNGPFSNLIFKILDKRKNLIKSNLGSLVLKFKKNSNLYFRPVK